MRYWQWDIRSRCRIRNSAGRNSPIKWLNALMTIVRVSFSYSGASPHRKRYYIHIKKHFIPTNLLQLALERGSKTKMIGNGFRICLGSGVVPSGLNSWPCSFSLMLFRIFGNLTVVQRTSRTLHFDRDHATIRLLCLLVSQTICYRKIMLVNNIPIRRYMIRLNDLCKQTIDWYF